MFKIIADSGCDILQIEGCDFKSVPLTISTAERSFTDDENLDIHEMVEYLLHYNDRSYTAIHQQIDLFKAMRDQHKKFM